MKCDPDHGPMVATVQVLYPQVSMQKDEVCADCLRWWEDYADKHPELTVNIEWLPTEAGWAESRASAVLLLGFLGLFVLAMGAL